MIASFFPAFCLNNITVPRAGTRIFDTQGIINSSINTKLDLLVKQITPSPFQNQNLEFHHELCQLIFLLCSSNLTKLWHSVQLEKITLRKMLRPDIKYRQIYHP